jgi:hypothetical protein
MGIKGTIQVKEQPKGSIQAVGDKRGSVKVKE